MTCIDLTACRTICRLMNGHDLKISVMKSCRSHLDGTPYGDCVGLFAKDDDSVWYLQSVWNNHEDAMKSLELCKVREEGIITQTTRGGDIYLNFKVNEQ